MNVLPRIRFYRQMVPISLPRSFFSTINSLFVKYVWHGKSPRLALRTLQSPEQEGGMDVPVIYTYYAAITLQRIDWFHNVTIKSWVPLEKFLAGCNLAPAPWLPRECHGLSEFGSPPAIHALKL